MSEFMINDLITENNCTENDLVAVLESDDSSTSNEKKDNDDKEEVDE